MNFDFIAEKAEVTGSIGKITGDINMAEQVRVVVDAMSLSVAAPGRDSRITDQNKTILQ